MKVIRRIIEAIKLFCTCKSTCIIGDPENIPSNNIKIKKIYKISYV